MLVATYKITKCHATMNLKLYMSGNFKFDIARTLNEAQI
jgi:hypothetical protein